MTQTSPALMTMRVRPLERLEAEIVELATQITGATARLLAMIGEFDAGSVSTRAASRSGSPGRCAGCPQWRPGSRRAG
jgi:hypothetical protein